MQPIPPTDSASPKKGDRSRALLLESALRIIAKSGIEAVTHRRVAEETGLTRGAVSYHFRTREQIILYAFRHYIVGANSLLNAISQDIAGKDIESIITGLVRYHMHEFHEPERVLAEYELILFAARNPQMGHEYRAWEAGLIAQLAALLEDAEALQPRLTAQLMLAVFRAFELESLTNPAADPADLRDRLRATVTIKSNTPRTLLSAGE